MQMFRRAGRATLAVAVLLCLCASARAEGVLDQVPSDAWVVFRVNRLEETNKKAAAWAEAMGIAQLSPDAADPLGALERQMNLKGIDKSKDLAIVMVDPGSQEPDKSILILVPTNDYKALAASLPNSKTEGNITTFRTEDEGDETPGYAANWGNYAALTPRQDILGKKPGGLKLTGLAAKEMQEKDAVIYANIPAMRAKLLPQLQKARADVKRQMQQQMGGAGAGNTTTRPPAATPPPNRTTPAARPGTTPGARPQPGTPPQQRPGQRPGAPGSRPQGRADDAAVGADVELVSFQQQPARRPAAPAQPARRPQQPAGTVTDDDADKDADTPGAGAEDPAAAMMKQYGPALSAMADQYFAAAERFLNDAQAATFSLNLTDAGLNTTLAAEFTQGSYLGKIASGMKNTDASLLAGLPGERKYFAFGGFNNSPEPLNTLVTDFVDPVLKQLAGTGQGGQNVTQLVEAVKKVIQNTKTTAMGYPAPTGALGTESIIQSVAVSTGNAKAIAEAQKTILQNMNTIMQGSAKAAAAAAGAGAAGGDAAPQVAMEFQEGAKTVGNVKLDQYKVNMQMDPDSPQAAQAQQMMGMIYGPNGMSGVLGAVNANTFVAVQGGTDQLIQAAVQAAQNPQDKLSGLGPVKATGGQLPQNRFAIFYFQLDQLISSGVRYAQGFGMPVKMQLPPNLPPLGFAAASEGTAVRFDSHIPTTTIQSIVAAGMQAYMQMQGGGAGQPGAPEGL